METNLKYGNSFKTLTDRKQKLQEYVKNDTQAISDSKSWIKWSKKSLSKAWGYLIWPILLTAVLVLVAVSIATSIARGNETLFGLPAPLFLVILSYLIAFINFIFGYLADDLFSGFLFFCCFLPFLGLLTLFVDYTYIIQNLISSSRSLKESIQKEANAEKDLTKHTEQLASVTVELEHLKAAITAADNLYEQAVAENDEAIMRKAADEGSAKAHTYFENKKQEEMVRKGEELYQSAISASAVDEDKMLQACELGNSNARLYMGRKMLNELQNVPHTKDEKRQYRDRAIEYLKSFDVQNGHEGVLVRLLVELEQDDFHPSAWWQSLLDQARHIQALKDLSKQNSEQCHTIICDLVDKIDYSKAVEEAAAAREAEERRRRIAQTSITTTTEPENKTVYTTDKGFPPGYEPTWEIW